MLWLELGMRLFCLGVSVMSWKEKKVAKTDRYTVFRGCGAWLDEMNERKKSKVAPQFSPFD